MAICFECCNSETVEEEVPFDSLFVPDGARKLAPDDGPTIVPSPGRRRELRALFRQLPQSPALELATSSSVPVLEHGSKETMNTRESGSLPFPSPLLPPSTLSGPFHRDNAHMDVFNIYQEGSHAFDDPGEVSSSTISQGMGVSEEGERIGEAEEDEESSSDDEEESTGPRHQDESLMEAREVSGSGISSGLPVKDVVEPSLVEQGKRPTISDLGSLRRALQEAVKKSPKDSTQFSHRLWTWEFITAVCLSCRRN